LENDRRKREKKIGAHSRLSRKQSRSIVVAASRPEKESDPKTSAEEDRSAQYVSGLDEQIGVDCGT